MIKKRTTKEKNNKGKGKAKRETIDDRSDRVLYSLAELDASLSVPNGTWFILASVPIGTGFIYSLAKLDASRVGQTVHGLYSLAKMDAS